MISSRLSNITTKKKKAKKRRNFKKKSKKYLDMIEQAIKNRKGNPTTDGRGMEKLIAIEREAAHFDQSTILNDDISIDPLQSNKEGVSSYDLHFDNKYNPLTRLEKEEIRLLGLQMNNFVEELEEQLMVELDDAYYEFVKIEDYFQTVEALEASEKEYESKGQHY